MGFRDMSPRPARIWCGGIFNPSPHPSSLPGTRRAARELGGLRRYGCAGCGEGERGAGLWSRSRRESRCAAWTRLHRSCSARHLSQRSKVIRPPLLRQVLSVSPHLLPSLQRWQLLAPLLTPVWKEERGKSSARPYCVYGSILCIHYIAASASAIAHPSASHHGLFLVPVS